MVSQLKGGIFFWDLFGSSILVVTTGSVSSLVDVFAKENVARFLGTKIFDLWS